MTPGRCRPRAVPGKRIVVFGQSVLVGAKVVARLATDGFDAVPASWRGACDALRDEGLVEALRGADVLVDVTGPPWSDHEDLLAYFTISTSNLLAAARAAAVAHYVTLSVVRGDHEPVGGYLRARLAQERLVAASGLRYSIVRATQFLDYARVVAELASVEGPVRRPPVHLQPIGSDAVVAAVARHAVGRPVDGVVEAGWAESPHGALLPGRASYPAAAGW
ncbi:SDR family oxidoreductase [Xylanimonas sp. McL0601]|uniref:SDR family oxidoreductase n=1 Tax=Xylanimonas sp. McL0601 TaxID=3414739 RepID=UPI003CFB3A57